MAVSPGAVRRPPAPRPEERELRAVAHELKTPLAIVFGYATTLLQQPALPEESRRWFLRVIADQSRRLLGTIDRLEELARLDGGVQTEIVDVRRSVSEAAERTLRSIPGARVLGAFGDGPPVFTSASRRWLDLAFEEALAACIAATGEAGTTTVHLPSAVSGEVRVRLETSPEVEARGLSVYLARRILGALGGTLEEERGRLTFVLPAP